MSHCLCSRLVELIVIVQSEHINNRKYNNSYTKNYECRQTIVCRDIAMYMRSEFLMYNDMQFLKNRVI